MNARLYMYREEMCALSLARGRHVVMELDGPQQEKPQERAWKRMLDRAGKDRETWHAAWTKSLSSLPHCRGYHTVACSCVRYFRQTSLLTADTELSYGSETSVSRKIIDGGSWPFGLRVSASFTRSPADEITNQRTQC